MNITSPGWPMSAPNNLDCTWYVKTNQYREVLLQIAEVETQPCCDQLRVSKAALARVVFRSDFRFSYFS